MGLFDEKLTVWPEVYPMALKFVDAVNASFWLHKEWTFASDIQDFHTKLDDIERNAIKNTLLAISQIEVDVKTFWSNLGNYIKIAEIISMGVTFGESEVRHERTYRSILEKMNLVEEFEKILEVPEIRKRVEYLKEAKVTKYVENEKQQFGLSLSLFSMFIEGVSLFSQFLIVKSFIQHKHHLKDLDNAIQSTQREEQLHLLAGVWLINEMKKEYPEWFGEDFKQLMITSCKKAYEAETGLLNWIFEKGELEFLPIDVIDNFIRYRFNECLGMIDIEPQFKVDEGKLKKVEWFLTELSVQVQPDFFFKKSNNYSKNMQAITQDDIF